MPDTRLDYDRLARSYDQRYVEHDYRGIERTLRTVLDGRRRVLEVGCGTGHWLEVVGGWGLDPSKGADEWYVYDYFAETLESDRDRYPASRSIRGWLREAGLQAASTVLAQRMSRVVEARPYLERGAAAKHVTSQLALLTEEAYVEGMASVWSDVRRAEAQGSALTLRADLHIYATSARVPE